MRAKNEIQHKVKLDLDQQQREYFLNQQLKAIQEELGDSADQEEKKCVNAQSKRNDQRVAENFEKEMKSQHRMNPAMNDYSVQRSGLDLVLDLPWGEYTKDHFDLKHAKKILDSDHLVWKKWKERIFTLSCFETQRRYESPNPMFVWPTRSW